VYVRRGDDSAAGLRQQLCDELVACLASTGWSLVGGDDDSSMMFAELMCPLGNGFAATAQYLRSLSTPDQPPVRITQSLFGVAYEPLRMLWPLLDDHARLTALTKSPEQARSRPMEVHTQDDVVPVAKRLAALTHEQAVAFAERYTSVDAVLDANRNEESGAAHMVVPALLAASGRFEEARSALARYRPDEPSTPEQSRRARRFVYQLNRWMDSGGNLALLPSEPPARRYQTSERASTVEAADEFRARKEAMDTIKQMNRVADRSELRAMVESELAAHGAHMDPLEIEQTIDRLQAPRAERSLQRVRTLKTLGTVGFTVAKALRRRELPDFLEVSVPGWLEPPTRAVYAAPQSRELGRRWTAVQLDEGLADWLDCVYAAAPRSVAMVRSGVLDAWLEWQGPGDAADVLAVHLGDRRVGILDDSATSSYRAVMHAATKREELPCVTARLTPLAAHADYLLELALPAP
jgi:hypothetical protein